MAGDLFTYVHAEWKEKQTNATDIQKILLEYMPASSLTRDLGAFRKVYIILVMGPYLRVHLCIVLS